MPAKVRIVHGPDRTEGFSALILAGGKSTRMGSDKAFLRINGLSLIENLIGQIDDLFEEILICTSLPEKYRHLNRRIAPDLLPGGGPMIGVLSGLRESRTEGNFVLTCDLPVVDRGFLERMMAGSADHDLVIPRYRSGYYEPLFGVYRKSAIPAIEEEIASGGARIAAIFPLCRTRFEEMDGETWYRNLNTADEYADFIEGGMASAAALRR